MRLYSSIGPNPRIVRMFMAEKGIAAQPVPIDLAGGENRRKPFLALNPTGQLPVLESAEGVFIAETTAICEYLEELTPSPALIGATPVQRAQTRMWARRVDLAYAQPVTAAFRYGPALDLFRSRVPCIPHAAGDMVQVSRVGEAWLNENLVGPFVAGEYFSLADIILFCFVDFAQRRAGLPLLNRHERLATWLSLIAARAPAQQTESDTYHFA